MVFLGNTKENSYFFNSSKASFKNARKLREKQTEAEELLWEALRNRQVNTNNNKFLPPRPPGEGDRGGEGFLHTFAIILLFLTPLLLSAQGKQANNWYFGNKAGITFQQGSPPVALLDGQSISPVETGTACMSDKDGNLLFYSNGENIWNKNHQIMTNGNNIGIADRRRMQIG